MLDGEYKFNNCIFKNKDLEIHEVPGCGACGGSRKSIAGFSCNKRQIILYNDENGPKFCKDCWVGVEMIDGKEVSFFNR